MHGTLRTHIRIFADGLAQGEGLVELGGERVEVGGKCRSWSGRAGNESSD